MTLPSQQILASPKLTGEPEAPTAPAGDSSELIANTEFVNDSIESFSTSHPTVTSWNGQTGVVTQSAGDVVEALGFTPVQQGTGVNQVGNTIKIGWSSGGQLLATVDASNLGNFLFGTDYTNLVNAINTKAAANQPYAYTGIGQSVSFGTIFSGGDIWAFSSDGRLKMNLQVISDALSKVRSLTGYLYKFKPDAAEKMNIDPDRIHMGLIAQDVEQVAPQVIGLASFDRDEETGESISGENYKTIQYEKLAALIIESIKELDDKVNALTKRVDALAGE